MVIVFTWAGTVRGVMACAFSIQVRTIASHCIIVVFHVPASTKELVYHENIYLSWVSLIPGHSADIAN